MAQRKLPARSDITSLLNRTEDNPQLPAYIRQLPATDLVRLVDYLGKEDAQALLVHATANQIRELVETDAWITPAPGAQERFSPDRFLEWLELWSDSGAQVLCQRVKELGNELLALTLHEYAVVVDIHEVGVVGSSDTFGRFTVVPKNEETLPLLFEFITQIWNEDPEFLEEVLGSCSLRRSLTIEKTYITHNENLALDVEVARDRRRRDHGYVTPLSAAAFLKRIRVSSLDELLIDGSYDGYSAVQLRSMQRSSPDRDDSSLPISEQKASEPEETRSPAEQALEELHAIFNPMLQSPALDVLLLEGPAQQQNSSYLERQLSRLGANNPTAADARMREILYLSNILMEGTSVGGARLDQRGAMLAAMHTANLGLTYCIFVEPWGSEEELLVELLENEPGLIKAFNVGYHLLMDLAQRVESATGAALENERVARHLHSDPELASEIRDSFSRYQNRRHAGLPSQSVLQELTSNLSILFDPATCAEIDILGDDFPRFPESLKPDFKPGLRVSRSAHFISELKELDVLANSVDALADWLLG